jgi:hypothetical protein
VERRFSIVISSTGSAGKIFEKTSNYAICNSFIAARIMKETITLDVFVVRCTFVALDDFT